MFLPSPCWRGAVARQSPQLPDDADRAPINNAEAVKTYLAERQVVQAENKEKAQLQATVLALQKQVQDLRTYLLMKAAETEANTPKGIPAAAPVRPQPAPARTSGGIPVYDASPSDGKSAFMQPHARGVLFSVTHATGKTDFMLPEDIRDALLEAARTSERIEVRGRTDSFTVDVVNRDIAMGRAVKAASYLVSQGVPIHRIKVTYQSAGRFAVDNSTPEGKARNRRVEIDTLTTTTKGA